VFLQGCPLDCWWCHNPENRATTPRVVVQETRCAVCFECARACPNALAAPAGQEAADAAGRCTLCGRCIDACPTGARHKTGVNTTAAELMTEIQKDRIFYEESGGGVTFSGGEPLRQARFLKEVLELCRRRGIHTAVDTCGAAAPADILAVWQAVDLWLYDLKFIDEQKHIEYTGASNTVILSNLRLLLDARRTVWLRIPIIPGINDAERELDAMARLAASLPGLARVHLLPYHKTGVAKFRRLGQAYRLAGCIPPSQEQMRAAISRFTAVGLDARAGG
jgi:pyruvate formate lyase activating enzyme